MVANEGLSEEEWDQVRPFLISGATMMGFVVVATIVTADVRGHLRSVYRSGQVLRAAVDYTMGEDAPRNVKGHEAPHGCTETPFSRIATASFMTPRRLFTIPRYTTHNHLASWVHDKYP